MTQLKSSKLDTKTQEEIPSLFSWTDKSFPKRQSTLFTQEWVLKEKITTLQLILHLDKQLMFLEENAKS